jgi:hypothetical protein
MASAWTAMPLDGDWVGRETPRPSDGLRSMEKEDTEMPTEVRPLEPQHAIAFLVAHCPLSATDLLGYAAHAPERVGLLGAYGADGLAGVAGVRTAPDQLFDHVLRLECESASSAAALIDACPPGRLYAKVHNQPVTQWLERDVGLCAENTEQYFAADAAGFVVGASAGTRKLCARDAHRFADPHPPAVATLVAARPDRDVYGIERDGCIVCSGVCSSEVRLGATSIAAIADVNTNERWGGNGLASALVGSMTSALLADHEHVRYWTQPDNRASQRVAAKVGYQPTHQGREFLIERPLRPAHV